METPKKCPACGADGDNCEGDFHQMLFWEAERPDYAFQVHHLLVLGYHMQHPHLYSPETLESSKEMLREFVIEKQDPRYIRKRMADSVDSGKRKHKITGTAESFGQYKNPPKWTMCAKDVVAAGLDKYVESVWAWAESIYQDLRESGNINS
jgi:Family of unknown function (DUF5946)